MTQSPGDSATIREYADNPAGPVHDDPACFSTNGLVLRDIPGWLGGNTADGSALAALTTIQDGVQNAAAGVIQDPAGSAIGAPVAPVNSGAGGGSGAIYKKFPDLYKVPAIAPQSAVFNASPDAGRRVLHSFSPMLNGDPGRAEDRNTALRAIANTYCNAIVAFNARSSALGNDGTLLNLVPVSAGIFGNAFRNPAYGGAGHLDPSYTLAAIALAGSVLSAANVKLPAMTLYYFGAPVSAAAQAALGSVNKS